MKGCDYTLNKVLKTTILYIAVFASALMIIALVITSAVRGAMADAAAVMTESQSNNSYWVRSHNGRIAVFDSKEAETPIIETTIDAEGLRAVDRDTLENGIEAPTYEDVLKLLEDFGS